MKKKQPLLVLLFLLAAFTACGTEGLTEEREQNALQYLEPVPTAVAMPEPPAEPPYPLMDGPYYWHCRRKVE